MQRAIDETGNRYGKLTVIERRIAPAQKRARWLCQCDCGNDAIVPGRSLRNGNTKSCGCLVSEIARRPKANPSMVELRELDTGALCEKYNISPTTVRRYRIKAQVEQVKPPDQITLISETDKAYLAGLIDGDGYITIKTCRKTAYPGVGVAQTDFTALKWAASILGATVSYHTRAREGRPGYHREQMIVRLHGRRARILCETILPYLKIKRKQAEIILQFPCDMRSGGLDDKTNQTRLKLQRQIQKLNSGVNNE